MMKTDDKRHVDRMKRWRKQEWLATPESKRSSSKEGETNLQRKSNRRSPTANQQAEK
jgi:hypothetical protein